MGCYRLQIVLTHKETKQELLMATETTYHKIQLWYMLESPNYMSLYQVSCILFCKENYKYKT